MAMRFEQSFVVKAPPGRVWAFLIDPRRAVAALPGAEISEKLDEKTYSGSITVKVGPVTAKYRGTVRFEQLDAALRSAEIVASGRDVGGRGGAEMRMATRVVQGGPGEGTTQVSVVSEVAVTGILAQFGRGMIQDVSNQMLEKFAAAVRAKLEGAPGAEAPAPEPAKPIEVFSLGTQVAGRAIGRAVRRPALWVAAFLLALIIWWLWFR